MFVYACNACLMTGGCILIKELQGMPDTCADGGNCPTEWVEVGQYKLPVKASV